MSARHIACFCHLHFVGAFSLLVAEVQRLKLHRVVLHAVLQPDQFELKALEFPGVRNVSSVVDQPLDLSAPRHDDVHEVHRFLERGQAQIA